jgi:hypothetical protein
MSTLEERLEEAAKQEDRIKQVDLVNQSFILHSARMIEFKDADGNDKQSMVAMISFPDETEQHEAWMDGVKVRPQIQVFQSENAFPSKVKLVKDGQAYKLNLIEQMQPVTAVNGAEATVTQGTVTVQQKAVEAFMAARTSRSEDDLTTLLADLDIEFAYDPQGLVTVSVEALNTQKALALKKKLA